MSLDDKIRETATNLFNEADVDKTGGLSKEELMPLVSQLGFAESGESWFQSIDPDGDKQISLDEFLDIILSRPQEELSDAQLRKAFKEVDQDGSGMISRNEMENVLQEMGIGADLIGKYIDMADTSNDGNISYEEFLNVKRG